MHGHGIAAEGEEHPVTEAEDAGEAPDQVQRQCRDGVAGEFAEQRHHVVGQVQRMLRRQRQIEDRREDGAGRHEGEQQSPAGRAKNSLSGLHRCHLRPPPPARAGRTDPAGDVG